MALLVRVLVSEGIILYGRPPGAGLGVGEGGRGRNWREVQEGRLCGLRSAGKQRQQLPTSLHPRFRGVASPLGERESDIGPKFDEVCFSSVTTCDRFPSGRGSTHGALVGGSGDLDSSPCSVTDAHCDLGQATFGPRGPHGETEDVNLQTLRIRRFSEFGFDLSTSILDYS